MSARLLIILLLTVGWFWFCNQWMCCWVTGSCCKQEAHIAPLDSGSNTFQRPPLQFSFKDPRPVTSETFGQFKSDLLIRKNTHNILRITGFYFPEEQYDGPYENLGIARAHFIKNLMLDRIPASHIKIMATELSHPPDSSSRFFDAAKFDWMDNSEIAAEGDVFELADRVFISFSDNGENAVSAEIEDYIEQLVHRLNREEDTILITAVSDAITNGLSDPQQKGMENLRGFLLKKGIDSNLVKIATGSVKPYNYGIQDAKKYQAQLTLPDRNR